MKNLALAKLQALKLSGDLAHAWLFVGPDINLQLSTAIEFSKWLLCAQPQTAIACGACKQCLLFAAGTNPDYCYITIEADSSSILIDSVRVLNNFLAAKAQFGQQKVVVLSPAEKLNKQAANALLKNLEEPGADNILILCAMHEKLLLPTIVSRCQILRFDDVQKSTESGVDENIQIIIKQLLDVWVTKRLTPIELVACLVKQWPNEVLYWFELILAELLVYKYSQDQGLLKYKAVIALDQSLDTSRVWLMLEKVQQARNWLAAGHRPNVQLVLEDAVLL